MGVGGRGVAAVHTFHSKPVKREGVTGFPGNELFEHLAAGFLLVGHCVVPYYTWAEKLEETEVESQKLKVEEKAKSLRGER